MNLQLFLSLEGRIGRSKFWISVLVLFACSLVLGLVASEPVQIAWQFVMLWPIIAISAKRWHDRDKSGWWVLINFIPVIGGIWALVENGFLKGSDGANRFGADPLVA